MKAGARVLQSVWSGLTLYLPLLLMGTLALATYWLYRNTPLPQLAGASAAPRHEVDYFMKDFALRTYDEQGQLRSEVHGTLMRHYPDTDTMEIEQARMVSFDERQQPTHASGQLAISNADGSEVQLLGQARIERTAWVNQQGESQPRTLLEGEFLHLFARTERVKSHKPVVVTRGNDRIESSTLDFSYLERTAQFSGRVSVTLQPEPAK